MHASLLLGGRHTLYAVDAAFVFELREYAFTFDDRDHFLQSAHRRFGSREHLDLPALHLGVARIHAEDFSGKERGFVAAGAGADFQNDVLLVVRIFGQKQRLQLFFYATDTAFQFVEFLLRVGAHLGVFFIGEHRLAVGNTLLKIFVFSVFLYNGRDFAVRPGRLLVFRRVVDDLR